MVLRNSEARDLFEIGKVFNLKFWLYLLRLGLGSWQLLEAVERCMQVYPKILKNMNRIILILFLLTVSKIYSQKIEREIGELKLTKEGFAFDDNKTTKKRKISKTEFYFDRNGKILERISFGRHHYNKLNVIGEIEQFFYSNDKLELSKKYISSCKTCEYDQYYSKYNYDEKNNLIREEKFYGKNDSLFMSTTYIFKPNVTETHFNSSTYYQKIYNSQNKVIELNQVFENTEKIRWQYLYEYVDNCQIGNFQTYYGDGKEHSKKEIECFDLEKRIISKEIFAGYKTKIIYTYSKKGFLKEIKEYESPSDDEYKLKYQLKFKIRRKPKNLTKEEVEKINSVLNE